MVPKPCECTKNNVIVQIYFNMVNFMLLNYISIKSKFRWWGHSYRKSVWKYRGFRIYIRGMITRIGELFDIKESHSGHEEEDLGLLFIPSIIYQA